MRLPLLNTGEFSKHRPREIRRKVRPRYVTEILERYGTPTIAKERVSNEYILLRLYKMLRINVLFIFGLTKH